MSQHGHTSPKLMVDSDPQAGDDLGMNTLNYVLTGYAVVVSYSAPSSVLAEAGRVARSHGVSLELVAASDPRLARAS